MIRPQVGAQIAPLDRASRGGFDGERRAGAALLLPAENVVKRAVTCSPQPPLEFSDGEGESRSKVHDQQCMFATNRVKPVRLGTITVPLNDEDMQRVDGRRGAKVVAVVKGSPAYENEFLRQDIIRKINGKWVDDPTAFSKLMDEFTGQEVEIEFIRGAKERTIKVKLN